MACSLSPLDIFVGIRHMFRIKSTCVTATPQILSSALKHLSYQNNIILKNEYYLPSMNDHTTLSFPDLILHNNLVHT